MTHSKRQAARQSAHLSNACHRHKLAVRQRLSSNTPIASILICACEKPALGGLVVEHRGQQRPVVPEMEM